MYTFMYIYLIKDKYELDYMAFTETQIFLLYAFKIF